MNKLFFLFFAIVLTFLASNTFSQEVDGKYKVGTTGCTVKWNEYDKVYKVYWDKGTGYTMIFFKEESPNGNQVFTEYQSDGTTFTGTFTFKDGTYNSGTYTRADWKEFEITKK